METGLSGEHSNRIFIVLIWSIDRLHYRLYINDGHTSDEN